MDPHAMDDSQPGERTQRERERARARKSERKSEKKKKTKKKKKKRKKEQVRHSGQRQVSDTQIYGLSIIHTV